MKGHVVDVKARKVKMLNYEIILSKCFVWFDSPCLKCQSFIVPVNCEWGDWKIGECDKSCGGGIRVNTREKKIIAENGGKECNGSATLELTCNTNDCPSIIEKEY